MRQRFIYIGQKAGIAVMLSIAMTIAGCGGSSGSENTGDESDVSGINSSINTPPTTQPDNSNDNDSDSSGDNSANSGSEPSTGSDSDTTVISANTADDVFSSTNSTARFLGQATFGATPEQLTQLVNTSASEWFKQQISLSPSLVLPTVEGYRPEDEEDDFNLFYIEATSFGFWQNSIMAADQLRQRMAFALSEILVVSNGGGEVLTDVPEAVASYQDILIQQAFGNYRELLEAVTYSPAMGYYLTYLGSEKGDEATGRMPDENYARELIQLFTLGVVELNLDGTVKLDDNEQPIETYTNQDITGLARVFTGLNLNETLVEESIGLAFSAPMQGYAESHSSKEKSFLGYTIPANTALQSSIDLALDHIFTHPNLAPFVSKQLIQRLVSSNPTPAYVEHVSSAFNTGSYQLPDGAVIGAGQRGDLQATLAAILFYSEARATPSSTNGKIREPILRFTHWARAFNVKNITPQYQLLLWDTSASSALAQHPYRSPSVFNFFRPGYKAPGSESASQGLVSPELQITNASAIPGYINFITYFITGQQQDADFKEIVAELAELGRQVSEDEIRNSFRVTYEAELALTSDAAALLNHLDTLLTAGSLSTDTRQHIISTIETMKDSDYDDIDIVHIAILMVMTSTDYLYQQ
ncbi:DUF1800 domain-containing protein [Thalassotalea euphylliae]|uniref:DUF1800 domain-containing protein n=1 Tax=Thalassotalea euphylliae TaxID=1655234 RepID=A0A3E0UGY1_9GAMM|nr:DUF1800 family protein [Thalassotalea euphylliae]REL35012.1 DUF1800 domain-containing protein [Thalassotalea euphylliae]